jgi:hypothetical protein
VGAFAIIPAAPVLLDDIDHIEDPHTAHLRTCIREVLGGQTAWTLPITALPPVIGLGGWGIDRGLDTRTGRFLTGPDWVDAVENLTETERTIAEAADPAIIVALLHAHAAGVDVGPLGFSENLLLPIDFSGASAADAPLAPVVGAADFDADVVKALTREPNIDLSVLTELCGGDEAVHANLSVLKDGIGHLGERDAQLSTLDIVFDERVHDVRSVCGTGTWA